jgi:hypothetical protein
MSVEAWTPAFPGQRPPFAPGHRLSVRSGAFGSRMSEPLAVELAEELIERRPDLANYPEEVAALCRVEARVLLLDRWLCEHGLWDRKKLREGPLRHLATFERTAAGLRRELGLSPAGEARMRRDQAAAAASVADIAAVMVAGTQTVARRREADQAAVEDDSGSAEPRDTATGAHEVSVSAPVAVIPSGAT